jgi:hypothetical protein
MNKFTAETQRTRRVKLQISAERAEIYKLRFPTMVNGIIMSNKCGDFLFSVLSAENKNLLPLCELCVSAVNHPRAVTNICEN